MHHTLQMNAGGCVGTGWILAATSVFTTVELIDIDARVFRHVSYSFFEYQFPTQHSCSEKLSYKFAVFMFIFLFPSTNRENFAPEYLCTI